MSTTARKADWGVLLVLAHSDVLISVGVKSEPKDIEIVQGYRTG